MMRQPWPLRAVDTLEEWRSSAVSSLRAGECLRGYSLLVAVIVLSAGLLAPISVMALLERRKNPDA